MGGRIPENEVAVVITPQNAPALLKSLRWRADTVVTNHEGEQIWLRDERDGAGTIRGITDCCLANDPCRTHALHGALNDLSEVRTALRALGAVKSKSGTEMIAGDWRKCTSPLCHEDRKCVHGGCYSTPASVQA